MTIVTMNDHDCPATVFNCIQYGFNDHVLKGENYDCINWLKNENDRIQSEMALIKEESIRRESDLKVEKVT